MARADELLRRLDVPHGAPQVRAAGGDHDVGLRLLALDHLVLALVELTDVDRSLARVADLGIDVHHARDVGLVVEVPLGPHVLPAGGVRALEDRTEGEAEPGQRERHGRDPAGGKGGSLHEATARDRLALVRAWNPAILGVAGAFVELLG
jgi:hypothetical protein